jgi:hypothetical protein
MPSRCISTTSPANTVTSSPIISVSTARALRDVGGRNAGTALEIASIPVIAVAPEEKARSTNRTVMPSIGSRPTTGVGANPRVEASTRPTAISANMASTNA